MNTYNFDKAIYVVGNEQALHFKQVFKVFELMGYENYAKNCVHVPFGLVVDKDGQKIRIIFERAIREETKFDSIFELKNQLKIDEDICLEGILDLSISDYPLL